MYIYIRVNYRVKVRRSRITTYTKRLPWKEVSYREGGTTTCSVGFPLLFLGELVGGKIFSTYYYFPTFLMELFLCRIPSNKFYIYMSEQ